jgi:dienelactone hydrolase
MQFISESASDGIVERLFTIGDVPGVIFSPAGAASPRPLLLLGHGGGQHKKAPLLVARALDQVAAHGLVVAAIDAPGHGDRPRSDRDARFSTVMRERMTKGQPVGQLVAEHNAELAAQAVPEWQLALDALQDLPEIGPGGPVGYLGMSLGCAIGVPLVASEKRITAAVLGLLGDNGLTDAAARIRVPVQFLLQWDDELVPRESALALFDAIGSTEKTLHANPGGHGGIPEFELANSEQFLLRHLLDSRQP